MPASNTTANTKGQLKSTGAPAGPLSTHWVRDTGEPYVNGAVHYVSSSKGSTLHLFRGVEGLWQIAPEIGAGVAYAVARSPAAHPGTVRPGEWLLPTPPDGAWLPHAEFHLKCEGPNSESQPYTLDELGPDFFLRVKNNKLVWFVDPNTGETVHSGAKAAGSKGKPGQRYCPLCKKCFSANNFVSQHLKNLHTPPTPTAPVCVADGRGGAALSWQAGNCPAGAKPVGFALECSLDGGKTWEAAVEDTGSAEPRARIAASSLHPGKSYAFRVAIHTIASCGPFSPPSRPFSVDSTPLTAPLPVGFDEPAHAPSFTPIDEDLGASMRRAPATPTVDGDGGPADFGGASPAASGAAELLSTDLFKVSLPSGGCDSSSLFPTLGGDAGLFPLGSSSPADLQTPPLSPEPSFGAFSGFPGGLPPLSATDAGAHGGGTKRRHDSSVASSPTHSAATVSPTSKPGSVGGTPLLMPSAAPSDEMDLQWTLQEILAASSSGEASPMSKRGRYLGDGSDEATFRSAPGPRRDGSNESLDIGELLETFAKEKLPPVYRQITPESDAIVASATAKAPLAPVSEAGGAEPSARAAAAAARLKKLRNVLRTASAATRQKLVTPELLRRLAASGWSRELALLLTHADPATTSAAASFELAGWSKDERAEFRSLVLSCRGANASSWTLGRVLGTPPHANAVPELRSSASIGTQTPAAGGGGGQPLGGGGSKPVGSRLLLVLAAVGALVASVGLSGGVGAWAGALVAPPPPPPPKSSWRAALRM